jgi:hypothetical protein
MQIIESFGATPTLHYTTIDLKKMKFYKYNLLGKTRKYFQEFHGMFHCDK